MRWVLTLAKTKKAPDWAAAAAQLKSLSDEDAVEACEDLDRAIGEDEIYENGKVTKGGAKLARQMLGEDLALLRKTWGEKSHPSETGADWIRDGAALQIRSIQYNDDGDSPPENRKLLQAMDNLVYAKALNAAGLTTRHESHYS